MPSRTERMFTHHMMPFYNHLAPCLLKKRYRQASGITVPYMKNVRSGIRMRRPLHPHRTNDTGTRYERLSAARLRCPSKFAKLKVILLGDSNAIADELPTKKIPSSQSRHRTFFMQNIATFFGEVFPFVFSFCFSFSIFLWGCRGPRLLSWKRQTPASDIFHVG